MSEKSETMIAIPYDDPLMDAWRQYRVSVKYLSAEKWAMQREHTEGSLWGAFSEGWNLATKRAADLHESVNPASDLERLDEIP